MSAHRYKRALNILKIWQRDTSKQEFRDIHVLLQRKVTEKFREGDNFEVSDPVKCDKMLTSLENICGDKHKSKYILSRPLEIGCMLLSHEELKQTVSNLYKEEKTEHASVWTQVKEKVKAQSNTAEKSKDIPDIAGKKIVD